VATISTSEAPETPPPDEVAVVGSMAGHGSAPPDPAPDPSIPTAAEPPGDTAPDSTPEPEETAPAPTGETADPPPEAPAAAPVVNPADPAVSTAAAAYVEADAAGEIIQPPQKDDPPGAPSPPPEADRSKTATPTPAVSALSVSMGDDVSEVAEETTEEFWTPSRPSEPETPPVEVHPEDPDAAPMVSGTIDAASDRPDDQHAGSALAVDFGHGDAEPSIQIEEAYQEDTQKFLAVADVARFDEETPPLRHMGRFAELPTPETPPPEPETPPPEPETPPIAQPAATASTPFDDGADTDPVPKPPPMEHLPTAEVLPSAEVLPTAEVLPSAEVDTVEAGDALPVYTVDESASLTPEEAPTKLSALMDPALRPAKDASDDVGPVVHPSPFPPALDEVRKAERPVISNAEAYSATETEPEAPVALSTFRPAAFVPTVNEELPGDAATAGPDDREATAPEAATPEATTPEATAPEATAPEATAPEATAPEATTPEQPETAPATQPSAAAPLPVPALPAAQPRPAEVPSAAEPPEPAPSPPTPQPSTAAPMTAAGVISGEIGGTKTAAPYADDAPLATTSASGSIIIDPELVAEPIAEAEPSAPDAPAADPAPPTAAPETTSEPSPTPGPPDAEPAPELPPQSAPPESTGTSLGRVMASTVRYELNEPNPEPSVSTPQTANPGAPAPAATQDAPPKAQAPEPRGQEFSDLEIAFFEEDLQKVEEVDTFEDLVEGLPEPTSPWGVLFGKNKKKRPEPKRVDESTDKTNKKIPRPPHKRK